MDKTTQATAKQPPVGKPKGIGLVDQALERLLNGPDIGPGSRLPTERALAEQLSVPRSAIRSALSRLEAHGRVNRIIGSGTYVTGAPPQRSEITPGQDASPREIMETRMLIEPRYAALIVAHANGADLERIREAMRGAEAARDFETFEICDGQFHQALADATHNRLMIEIYRTITLARELAEWGEMKRRSITPERRAAYEREHREIAEALQLRDIARAEAALTGHLVNIRQNLLGS